MSAIEIRLATAFVILVAATAAVSIAAAQTWSDITPGGDAPSPRINLGAVNDPIEHRIIIYGGRGSGGDVDDMLALNLATEQWSPMEQTSAGDPGPRYTHNMLYDPDQHQLILWSGRHTTSSSGSLKNVWSFDLSAGRWTLQAPAADQPNAQYGTAAMLDPRSRELVNFAGFTEAGRWDELWSFDLETNTWESLALEAEAPEAREGAAAVYVPSEGRMILFAGRGDDGNLNDVWTLDGLGSILTTIGEAGQMVPSEPGLSQNRPNPFNGATVIPYDLRADGPVSVAVHDLLGRHIKSLVTGSAAAGSYTRHLGRHRGLRAGDNQQHLFLPA